MPRRIKTFACIPRFKGIFYVRQASLGEFGVVTQENRLEIGIVNPGQPFGCVGLFVVTGGIKAVGLEAT